MISPSTSRPIPEATKGQSSSKPSLLRALNLYNTLSNVISNKHPTAVFINSNIKRYNTAHPLYRSRLSRVQIELTEGVVRQHTKVSPRPPTSAEPSTGVNFHGNRFATHSASQILTNRIVTAPQN
ncbi:hypothetical protein FOZ60_003626 [Perkinsus olseni]|uniref:Uncharacterized protein n=1 Tax=Perkinsus olseni TaxID=32597 RepID=A0A7J6NVS2_PEROL|nr:hypothetical protein FOZ60_003626 [Perkinsus olseni]